jgi:hypothetical protein
MSADVCAAIGYVNLSEDEIDEIRRREDQRRELEYQLLLRAALAAGETAERA